METVIERARRDDSEDVIRLLERNHLPVEGLSEHVATTLVARRDSQIIGSAALEVYPDGVLLRSVAVAPDLQAHGIGRALTEAAIRLAQNLGAPAIYLLTTTAEQYFPKFGFDRIGRDDVPATVRTSVEFTSACPSTAAVMRKTLITP